MLGGRGHEPARQKEIEIEARVLLVGERFGVPKLRERLLEDGRAGRVPLRDRVAVEEVASLVGIDLQHHVGALRVEGPHRVRQPWKFLHRTLFQNLQKQVPFHHEARVMHWLVEEAHAASGSRDVRVDAIDYAELRRSGRQVRVLPRRAFGIERGVTDLVLAMLVHEARKLRVVDVLEEDVEETLLTTRLGFGSLRKDVGPPLGGLEHVVEEPLIQLEAEVHGRYLSSG